jgi:hypothetical protein
MMVDMLSSMKCLCPPSFHTAPILLSYLSEASPLNWQKKFVGDKLPFLSKY